MEFLIAGASGFLGSRLRERLLQDGHHPVSLVRRPAGANEVQWDPYAGPLDPAVLDGIDVVVNLAGAPTLGNPHSKKWAENLLNSRVTTTRVLAKAIAAAPASDKRWEPGKPIFLAGNGISYYGDRGEEVLTEESDTRGDAFLTKVTREWQAAAQPAVDAGSRVCILRTSPVLDQRSQPLSALTRLFKLGLGGPIGSGAQYFPVISTRDWVSAVVFLARNPVRGPVNLVMPEPATNGEFTRELAKQVKRPAFFKVPAPVVRAAASRMAPEVLGSVRAVPRALLNAGFEFADPGIEYVLKAGLHA